MVQRNVTTSGAHLANALVTPPGGAPDVTLANVAEMAARGMSTIGTIADLRAYSPGSTDATVYVRGYHTPGDGGGGMFLWAANSSATVDGGTVIDRTAGGTGRWLRMFESGTINAKWFATEDDLLSYCTSNRPLTIRFSPGVYNFANKTLPAGIHCVGPGWLWSSGQTYGGFGLNAAVMVGPIMQGTGPSGASFRNLVFSGGFTIAKQYNLFDNCAFTGASGTLTLNYSIANTAPYCNTISHCTFRGITGGPCVYLKGQANANRFINSVFLIGEGERGIVAEYYINEGPLFGVITGCDFEKHGGVTSIGSFIYGAFKKFVFLGNYFDAAPPIFNDGAAYVFDSYSRDNRVWHGSLYSSAEPVLNAGLGNIFHCSREGQIYSNGTGGAMNLAEYAGVPTLYAMGTSVQTGTLPPINRCYSQPIKILTKRSEGTTIAPAAGQTINGASSFAMTAGTIYTFYAAYGGAAVTDWNVAEAG